MRVNVIEKPDVAQRVFDAIEQRKALKNSRFTISLSTKEFTEFCNFVKNDTELQDDSPGYGDDWEARDRVKYKLITIYHDRFLEDE